MPPIANPSFISGFDTLNVVDGTNNLLHATHEQFGDAAKMVANIAVVGDRDRKFDVCSNGAIDQVLMAGP